MRRTILSIKTGMLAFVMSLGVISAQAQNTCATATVIAGNGTINAPGPSAGGGANNFGATNANWYTFVPTGCAGGTIDVTACPAAATDTRLYIYDGACGSLNQIGFDDDACGYPPGASEILGLAVASTVYIEWDDRWSTAAFDFDFTYTANPPSNTTCGAAISLPGAGTYTACPPNAGGGATNFGATNASWYSFDVPDCTGGTLGVTACPGATIDTRLWIYEGACGSLNQIGFNDDGCGYPPGSSVVGGLAVSLGTVYIEWDDRWSTSGFDFDLTYTPNAGPTNTTCATATNIGVGTHTACGPASGGGATNAGATNAEFYSFTVAECNGGVLDVTACPAASTDTRLYIYDGACGSLNQIGFNDDGCGYPPGSSEALGVAVNQGTVYIEWDDRWSSAGFDFDIAYTANPTNDVCANATVIPGTGTYTACGPTTGGNATQFDATNAEFYTFTPPSGGLVDVSTCGLTSEDTRFWIYDGGCGALNLLDNSDDDCGGPLQSSVTGLVVAAGQQIWIEWDDRWDNGSFDFDFTFTVVLGPGEGCSSALPITTNGIYNAPAPAVGGGCENCVGATNATWYEFDVTDCDGGTIDITTCGLTSEDTRLWIYSGDCATLTQVADSDDDCGGPLQSDVTGLAVTQGTYYFEWDDRWATPLAFDFSFTYTANPLPTTCASATVIPANGIYSSCGPASGGGCENCGLATNAEWWTYTAPDDGTVNVLSCGYTTEDTRLWIYDGGCGTLNQIGASDDDCGGLFQSGVLGLAVTNGQQIWIEWDDRWSSNPFDFEFTFTSSTPTGDFCGDAIPITGNGTISAPGPIDGGGANGSGTNATWYSFEVTDCVGGTMDVSACAAAASDTRLHIYDGSCGTLNPVADNDDACGYPPGASEVTGLAVTPGFYYIEWTDRWSTADFDFDFTYTPNTVPETCGQATVMPGTGTYTSCGPASGGGATDFAATNADWWTFTAPSAGIADVSACGLSGTDTRLWVYDGGCGSLNQLGFDDDACGYPPGNSEITGIVMTSGQQIWVEWDDRWSSAGFDFDFTFTAGGPPTGWSCADPLVVVDTDLPYTHAGQNTSTYLDDYSTTPCSAFYIGGDDVVYTYTNGSGADQYIDVTAYNIAGTYGGLQIMDDCPDLATTCIDQVQNGASIADMDLTGVSVLDGETVYIVVSSWPAPQSIGYDLDITIGVAPPAPPANDDCAGAQTLAVGVNGDCPATGTFNQTGMVDATASATSFTSCDAFGTNIDVFFDFVAPAGGSVEINLTNVTATGTAEAAVLDACGGTELPGACWFPADGQVITGLTPGNTYVIQVWYDDFGGTSVGDFDICLQEPPGPPANDECGTAIPIACGATEVGTTSGATVGTDPTAFCGTTPGAAGVWYSVTGDGTTMTADLCNGATGYDSKINVYSGACGALVCVAGNDDFCGVQSTASWASVLGTDYFIFVNGFGGQTGDFELTLTCTGPPANDECLGAIAVTCGSTTAGSTSAATIGTDPTAFCGTTPDAPGIWYTITGDGSDITADLCNGNTTYDSKINVYSGGCLGLVCVDGNDDACGSQSSVTWSSVSGTDYFILVNGWNGNTGDFELEVNCVLPGDDPCAPIALALGECAATYDNTGYTTTGPTPATCWATGGSGTSGDIWFSFVAPTGGDVTIETFENGGSMTNTQMALYNDVSGTCPVPVFTEIDCDDDGGTTLMSQINAAGLTAGTTYLVQVVGRTLIEGSFDISVIDNNAPLGDICSDAVPIFCNDTVSGTNVGAYVEPCTPVYFGGADYVAPSVWYAYTETTTAQQITVTTCFATTDYDTRLSVLTGSCGALTPVVDNDDDNSCVDGGLLSTAVFNSVMGETYYIKVHGWGAFSEGNFDLSLICAPLCVPIAIGDDCASATNLPVYTSGTAVPLTHTNECALAGPQTSCEPFSATYDLWYEFTMPAGETDLVIQTPLGTAGSLNYAVWDGCGGSQLGLCLNGVNGDQLIVGFTPGTQYWLQVWTDNIPDLGSYNISLELPPPPPTNDTTCLATPLIVNAAPTTATNAYATPDGPDLTLTSCWTGASGLTQDVWFSFVAPGLGAVNIETFDNGGLSDTQLGLWEVSGCPGVTPSYDNEVDCDDDGGAGFMSLIEATGLTPGATYHVQVSGWGGQFGEFQIRVTTPTPVAINEYPCNAFTLPVGGDCTYSTTTDNTGVNEYITGSCGGNNGVWYHAVVPASGTLVVNMLAGSASDAVLTAYTMTDCDDISTWTEFDCDDDDGQGFMSYLYLDGDQGLSPGDDVYLQVSSFSGFSTGTYQICATQGIVWSGASSNVYTLGSNWFHGGPAPLADENAIISPNATNPCTATLPGAVSANMWVLNGATLDVTTGVEIGINGDLIVGTTPQSFGPGIISMEGASAQQILTSPGGPLTFEELVIDNAAGVTVSPTSGVSTVNIEGALRLDNGDLDVSGADLTLVSNAGGQAYLDDWDDGGTEMTTGTITGDITVQRYVSGPGYHHIGPPVLNPSITQLSSVYSLIGVNGTHVTPIDGPGCNDTTLEVGSAYAYTYRWDENGPFTGSGCTLWGYEVASSGTANTGEGIAATQVNPGDFTINWSGSVTGAPGAGTVSYGGGALGNSGGDGNGFHLLSNMFATPIAWTGTGNFPGAAYTWNDGTGNYDSHPAFLGFPLAIGQGFFAQAGGTGSFELDNTDKLDNSDPAFLRSSSVIGDYSLQLDVTGNGFTHFTVMAFANDLGGNACTNGWDIACDAYALPGTTGQPFMYSSTTEAVMASPNRLQYNTQMILDNATRSIPLSLDPGTNGSFTITASDLESFPVGTGIVLEDVQLGVMHDLNANPSYAFTALASDYDPNNPTNRFVVHFSPASVTDLDNVIDINAGFYTAGDQLIMQLNVLEPVEGVFSVLNAVGQEVMSNDNITTINGRHSKDVGELANGVYVVRFVTENKTFSGKFVKH